jgi:hypothetical protein
VESGAAPDFSLPIPGPGGEIRFAVGSPDGPRSAMWKLFSPKNKSDVYLAYRAAGRYVKVSLHQSGNWRFQWISPDVAREAGAIDGTRVIEQWQRPAADEGWTIGPMILVSERDVVPLVIDQPVDGVKWFPAPAPGHGVWIHIFIVEPGISAKNFSDVSFGGGFHLANGEVCVLLARQRPITPEEEQWLETQRRDDKPESGVRVDEGQVYARMLTYRADTRLPPLFFDLAIRARETRP